MQVTVGLFLIQPLKSPLPERDVTILLSHLPLVCDSPHDHVHRTLQPERYVCTVPLPFCSPHGKRYYLPRRENGLDWHRSQ